MRSALSARCAPGIRRCRRRGIWTPSVASALPSARFTAAASPARLTTPCASWAIPPPRRGVAATFRPHPGAAAAKQPARRHPRQPGTRRRRPGAEGFAFPGSGLPEAAALARPQPRRPGTAMAARAVGSGGSFWRRGWITRCIAIHRKPHTVLRRLTGHPKKWRSHFLGKPAPYNRVLSSATRLV